MILAGLVVLLLIMGLLVGFYIGPIVKMGIEQVGPKVTQVPVTVDSVGASLTGSATLQGLKVGNPQGFSAAQAFSAGTISVSIDPMTVTSKKILVHSIHVVSPEITFEGGLSGNNLTKILDNVNAFIKSYVPPSNNPPPKIEVDDFLISGAKVNVNIQGVGNKTVPLPDIHLTDLGKGNDGVTPQELIRSVLSIISSDTVKTVAANMVNLRQGLQTLGKSTLNNIASNLGGLLKQ